MGLLQIDKRAQNSQEIDALCLQTMNLQEPLGVVTAFLTEGDIPEDRRLGTIFRQHLFPITAVLSALGFSPSFLSHLHQDTNGAAERFDFIKNLPVKENRSQKDLDKLHHKMFMTADGIINSALMYGMSGSFQQSVTPAWFSKSIEKQGQVVFADTMSLLFCLTAVLKAVVSICSGMKLGTVYLVKSRLPILLRQLLLNSHYKMETL